MKKNLNIASAIMFCVGNIEDILNKLHISEYYIGGSIAGIVYGCNFKRIPHDIDIIVPEGTVDVIKERLERNIWFNCEPSTSSLDDEWNTKHVAVRTAKSLIVDFIECSNYTTVNKVYVSFGHSRLPFASMRHLIEAKQKYHRLKDVDDLKELQRCALELGLDDEGNEISKPETETETESV